MQFYLHSVHQQKMNQNYFDIWLFICTLIKQKYKTIHKF